MKRLLTASSTALALQFLAIPSADAQTGNESANATGLNETGPATTEPFEMEKKPSEELNRLSFSYRMGFNLSAKFTGLGGYGSAASFPAPPEAGPTPRVYDNGYIRPALSPQPGTTWDYQYTSPTQTENPPNLYMQSTSGQANGSLSAGNNNTSQGLELIYDRQLGHLGKATWGLEAGLGFQNININQSGTAYGSINGIQDTYTYDSSVTLYPAPYTGHAPFEPGAPTPLIPDTPTSPRQTYIPPYSQVIGGAYQFDSSVFSFRLGPYLEYPLGEKWRVSISGGFSLVGVSSTFAFNESVVVNGVTQANYSNPGATGSGWIPGGYGGGRITYFATEDTSFFVGAQWQGGGTYTQQATAVQAPNQPAKEAQLSFGGTFYFMAGIGFSF